MKQFTKNKLFVYELNLGSNSLVKATTSGYCNRNLNFNFIEFNYYLNKPYKNILDSLISLKRIILNGLDDSYITFKVSDYKTTSNQVKFSSLVDVGNHNIHSYESTINDMSSIDEALLIFKKQVLEDFNEQYNIFKYDLNYMQDLNELITVFTEAAKKEQV